MSRSKLFHKLVLLLSIFVSLRGSGLARENPDKFFAYLQDVYNRHDKNLHNFLLAELSQYVAQFPAGEKTPEAQYLLAKVYQEKGDKQKAAAAFLKTIYLYPGTSWQQQAAQDARKLISEEGVFKDKRAKLLALVEGTPQGQSPADRYYEYLHLATVLDHADAYGALLDDARKFLILFPEDTRQDSVLQKLAEIYAKKGDEHEAEVSYLRLTTVAPKVRCCRRRTTAAA